MAASTATREAATLDPMAGRAKVRDDDRLRAFYRELEAHEAGALWTVLNALEPDHPTAAAMQARGWPRGAPSRRGGGRRAPTEADDPVPLPDPPPLCKRGCRLARFVLAA